jgi:retinol dehydrogenase 12
MAGILHEYCMSKLCNILFTRELARTKAGPNVRSYAVHPGYVGSEIFRRIRWPLTVIVRRILSTNEDGARTSLHCATSPDAAGENGLYYDKCRPKNPSALAQDEALASKLWEVSEEMVAPFTR